MSGRVDEPNGSPVALSPDGLRITNAMGTQETAFCPHCQRLWPLSAGAKLDVPLSQAGAQRLVGLLEAALARGAPPR